MGTCQICGKETSEVMDGDGLCWLCRSKQRINEERKASTDGDEREFEEKRAWARYPVQIFLRIRHTSGEEIDAVSPGMSVNLSMGGLCVETGQCAECTGYTPGGVHPDCIYGRYDNRNEGSGFITVSIYLSETDVITVKAKVVFVMKRDDRELVGLCFTDNDQSVMARIQYIIDTAVNGEEGSK